MSGTAASETETTTEQTTTETTVTDESNDWKARAREWEKRAKANADAASRLAELEESQKSEAQKLADAKAAAEKEASDARAEAMRWRVAAKHGVSDDDAELFLTGTDEETLTKQAQRLGERESDRKKNGNVASKEGTNSNERPKTNDVREFTRGLFGRDDS